MPRSRDDEDDRRQDDVDDRTHSSGGGAGPVLWIGLGLAGVVCVAVVGATTWFVVRPKPEMVVNNPDPGGNPPAKPTTGPLILAPKHRIKTGLKEIGTIYLSADGRRVAVNEYGATKQHQLEVWDIGPPHKKVRTFERPAYAMSPDGRLLAVEGDFPSTEVMDVESGRVVSRFWWSPGLGAAFAGPDTLVIMSNSADPFGANNSGVYRFDAKSGRHLGSSRLFRKGTQATLAVAHVSKELVVAEDRPGVVSVVSMTTGSRVRGAALAGFPATVSILDFAVCPDGTRVAVAWNYMPDPVVASSASVYDTTTGDEVWSSVEQAFDKVLMPNRDVVLARTNWMVGKNGIVGRWRAYDLRVNAVVADIDESSDANAVVSADGRLMAVGRSELLVFDLTTLPRP